MSVLFLMPQWEAFSEVWMHRMLAGLSKDLAAVAVPDACGNTTWRGQVQAISLAPVNQRIRYFSRIVGFLGLSLEGTKPKAETTLRRVVSHLPVTRVLCQYGTFATKFMKVWQEIDLPLFVHFHGYDATFDLCVADQPDKVFFSNGYLSSIKELEQRATFIANSEFTKSLLVNAGIAPDHVFVKYYGVPVPEKRHIHNKRDKIQILHLGRLVDFKSPDRTIKAFEIARSEGLDCNLVIGGDGPLRITCELLRLRSPYRDYIRILGAVNPHEAQTLFSESDIFTQHNIMGEITRQSECFGVSIVEAMASGLPVVGTKNGGVIESVIHGETGFLNNPGDVEAQAEAFLELGHNPDLRQKMADAGRARVSAFFSPRLEIQRLHNIMRLNLTNDQHNVY